MSAIRCFILALLAARSSGRTGPGGTSGRACDRQCELHVRQSALKNPINDATGVAKTLRELGFEVTLVTDLDKANFEQKIQAFANSLPGASAAVFYYAGHGMQVDGRNYLVPVDAKINDEADLPFELVSIDIVLHRLAHHRITNIVILDACRDNPLGDDLSKKLGDRVEGGGAGACAGRVPAIRRGVVLDQENPDRARRRRRSQSLFRVADQAYPGGECRSPRHASARQPGCDECHLQRAGALDHILAGRSILLQAGRRWADRSRRSQAARSAARSQGWRLVRGDHPQRQAAGASLRSRRRQRERSGTCDRRQVVR